MAAPAASAAGNPGILRAVTGDVSERVGQNKSRLPQLGEGTTRPVNKAVAWRQAGELRTGRDNPGEGSTAAEVVGRW